MMHKAEVIDAQLAEAALVFIALRTAGLVANSARPLGNFSDHVCIL